jgi:outer membrane protein OmpA-like peptidoglycan-associated protein
MQPVKLINGRTPEQWAAYDRAKLIGAVSLGLLLVVLLLAGRGPGRAAGCCEPPAAAAVPPATLPTVAPTPDHGCADALESDVLFATDSAELTPEGRALLDRLAPCWSHGRFEIEGHTDNTGTDAINQPLSERRAQAIVDELIKDGIDASALTARGYGSSRPVADNASPEGRAKNRRVEFRKQ